MVQSTAGALAAALLAPAAALGGVPADTLTIAKRTVTTNDAPTPYQAVTSFNNFYEFGADTDHGDPARHAGAFKPRPWSVTVEGACARPGGYTLEDILKPHPIEERVYACDASKAGRWSFRGMDFLWEIC
jgi:sulfoxide reductase catalytic subunit YedY